MTENLLEFESHFSFGENWAQYAQKIDERRIEERSALTRACTGAERRVSKSRGVDGRHRLENDDECQTATGEAFRHSSVCVGSGNPTDTARLLHVQPSASKPEPP